MRVEEQIAHKVDPELWRALTEASGDEILRTVMVLGNGNLAAETPSIDPSGFSNRTDYQRALRTQQQERVSGAVRPVQKQLEQLDLKTHGGEFSRSVVVEGTAQKILASLQLPGVQHASLDQTLTLDPSAALT